MKFLLKQALLLGTLGVVIAGCQSKAEEEVNKQAEAISDSYDAEAKLVEAQAANAPDEKAAKTEAQELREEGDMIEDRLKDDAKKDLK